MKRRSPARVELISDDHAITRTPYSVLWIESLKHLIPADAREYDPETKEWAIYGSHHVDAVVALTKRIFPQVELIDRRREPSRSRAVANLDADYARLHLLPSAPPYAVRLMYREEAKRAHPDHGGEHEVMLALNASFERLQQAGAA